MLWFYGTKQKRKLSTNVAQNNKNLQNIVFQHSAIYCINVNECVMIRDEVIDTGQMSKGLGCTLCAIYRPSYFYEVTIEHKKLIILNFNSVPILGIRNIIPKQ